MVKNKFIITCLLLLISSLKINAQYNVNAYLLKAKRCIADEKFSDAIKLLNICLEAQPGNTEAYFYRGGCKFYLEDNIGAESDFTSALSTYSSVYYESYTFRSQVRYRLGNYPGAISDLNKVIEKEDSDPKLFIERAFAKLSSNDFEGAITDCKKAVSLNFVGEDLWLCKGTAEYALGEYEKSLEDYFKTLSINPLSEDGLVRRGMSNFKLNNFCEAKADYEAAIRIDSACTFAYYNRAELEIQQNENNEALNDYNKVLTAEPRNAAVYFSRATLYANIAKYKEAIKDFDKVLIINPENIQAAFNRAKLKQEIKDYKGALQDYDYVINLYPYFMEAYYNKSKIKYLMKDAAGAMKDFNTGKMMSTVFHSRSEIQLHRDSVYLSKLMDLNSGFNSVSLSQKTDSTGIGIRPVYYLMLKDSNNTQLLYSGLTEKFNKLNKQKIGLSNGDNTSSTSIEELNKTRVPDKNDDKVSMLTDAINKSNASLLNDAADELNKLITLDSLNSLVYFARGINSYREVEMMADIEVPYYINTKKQGITDNSKNQMGLASIADFSKVIELQPQCEYAYFNRGYVKTLMHDYNGAVSDYEKATQINSTLAEAFYNEGIVLFYLNYKEQACAVFSKAGELGIKAAYSFIQKHCSDLSK